MKSINDLIENFDETFGQIYGSNGKYFSEKQHVKINIFNNELTIKYDNGEIVKKSFDFPITVETFDSFSPRLKKIGEKYCIIDKHVLIRNDYKHNLIKTYYYDNYWKTLIDEKLIKINKLCKDKCFEEMERIIVLIFIYMESFENIVKRNKLMKEFIEQEQCFGINDLEISVLNECFQILTDE